MVEIKGQQFDNPTTKISKHGTTLKTISYYDFTGFRKLLQTQTAA
jgi:hypothetical protein